MGSVTYPEGLLKDPTMNAEQVLASGGIWKTMRVESVEDFSGAGARGMPRGV